VVAAVMTWTSGGWGGGVFFLHPTSKKPAKKMKSAAING